MRGVWCALHSEAAFVIRSRVEDTKFHPMKRGGQKAANLEMAHFPHSPAQYQDLSHAA